MTVVDYLFIPLGVAAGVPYVAAVFALQRKTIEDERFRAVQKAKQMLEETKIRDDKGYWNQIEIYIEKHSDAHFSHGICQECQDKLYGDQNWYKRKK